MPLEVRSHGSSFSEFSRVLILTDRVWMDNANGGFAPADYWQSRTDRDRTESQLSLSMVAKVCLLRFYRIGLCASQSQLASAEIKRVWDEARIVAGGSGGYVGAWRVVGSPRHGVKADGRAFENRSAHSFRSKGHAFQFDLGTARFEGSFGSSRVSPSGSGI
jgi:hypothetical protein